MKSFKKVGAWFMALVFVTFMMGTSVFAEDTVPGHPTGTITVSNVEKDATVTAYQITEGVYKDNQVTDYKQADNLKVTLSSVTNPSQDDVTAVAKSDLSGLTQYELKNDGADPTTFSAAVEPGSYVVLVTGTVDRVYNPMLLSVSYALDGSLTGGNVNAGDKFNGSGYAKSTEITVKKTIDDINAAKTHGTDALKGSVIPFKITTTIPSYSKKYGEVKFDITDTLDGLVLESGDVKVDVGTQQNVSESDVTYKLTKDSTSIKISFASAYIKQHGGETVVVTYNAVVPNDAKVNMDANTNKVTLSYTNNNGEVTEGKSDTDNVYTFEINGEIYKIDSDTTTTPLSGAIFALTKVADRAGNPVTGATPINSTDENGKIKVSGLDAGTYVMKEVTPPTGYQLSGTTYMVKITPSYIEGESGELQSYTVKIWQGDPSNAEPTEVSQYKSFTFDKDNKTPITFENSYRITNTKLAALPSTGGMGTYLFTFGGITLMTAAAVMYVMTRKNKEKVEK